LLAALNAVEKRLRKTAKSEVIAVHDSHISATAIFEHQREFAAWLALCNKVHVNYTTT